MDAWKEFEQNPITHSVAHHLVAISELHEEYGYARVSDVARALKITRGSASITLKRLKQRGLVVEDDRRFLLLSPEGDRIAHLVKARKFVMMRLFIDLLGVDEQQADIDTCKIEHLISNKTARAAARVLRFLESEAPEVAGFIAALDAYSETPEQRPVVSTPHDMAEVYAVFQHYTDPDNQE